MENRYKATAPNREYNGRTCGVRFENGTAYFDDLTINQSLGLDADGIAHKMKNEFGYKVEIISKEKNNVKNTAP